MEYLVCLKQRGEGCDYTIGCGYIFKYLDAASIDEAVEQIVWPEGRVHGSNLEGEDALETILIIPSEYVVTVDVEAIREEVLAYRAQEKADQERTKEIAQLNRLMAKYHVRAG
jgi:hypothetical protein